MSTPDIVTWCGRRIDTMTREELEEAFIYLAQKWQQNLDRALVYKNFIDYVRRPNERS